MKPLDPILSNQTMNIENSGNELEIPSWILKLNRLKADVGSIENETFLFEQMLTVLKNEKAALELQLKNISYIENLEKEMQILEERYSKLIQSKLGKIMQLYWKVERRILKKVRGW
jgi:hypothetical protein